LAGNAEAFIEAAWRQALGVELLLLGCWYCSPAADAASRLMTMMIMMIESKTM